MCLCVCSAFSLMLVFLLIFKGACEEAMNWFMHGTYYFSILPWSVEMESCEDRSALQTPFIWRFAFAKGDFFIILLRAGHRTRRIQCVFLINSCIDRWLEDGWVGVEKRSAFCPNTKIQCGLSLPTSTTTGLVFLFYVSDEGHIALSQHKECK